MAELKGHQPQALEAVRAFLASGAVAFSLQGGAGVGKTFVTSHLVRELLAEGRAVGVAAPTHKACRVLRGKLDAAGVPWQFKPTTSVEAGKAVVDTTAALLGIRPVIDDDQGEDELKFKATGAGSLAKLFEAASFSALPPVLVIDEVSMLGREDMQQLAGFLRERGAKLVAVGDEGQLPPVKKSAIDFGADFDGGSFTMTEVLRQAKGSSIVDLAWAIRSDDAEPWAAIDEAALVGQGVVRHESTGALLRAFIDQLEAPVDDESQRSCFIAYRNAVVDEVQDRACHALYDHSAREFRAGELVLASTPVTVEVAGTYVDRSGYERTSKFKKLKQLCAVADQLRVVEFRADAADPIYGVPVVLDRVDVPAGAANRRLEGWYLSPEQLADAAHPFNAKKRELADRARDLQAKVKAGQHQLEEARRDAWAAFFKHQGKVLSFSHPFAITSHKSQGSTYREVFVHAADLLRFNRRALYVAVTRPSTTLHL